MPSKSRKPISFILTFALVTQLCPLNAFAANDEGGATNEPIVVTVDETDEGNETAEPSNETSDPSGDEPSKSSGNESGDPSSNETIEPSGNETAD